MINPDLERSIKPRPSPSRSTVLSDYWSRVVAADITKIFATASALLYGILFVAYRRYYDALGITPEDVGVTNTFILVRSPGFIIITVAVALTLFGFLRLHGAAPPASGAVGRLLRRVIRSLLSMAMGYYFYSLFPRSTPIVLLVMLLVVLLSAGPVLQRLEKTRWASLRPVVIGGITLGLAVILPVVAVVQQAAARGAEARSCNPVSPFSVGVIPILDVDAPPILLTWSDPQGAPPLGVFGSQGSPASVEGILLGQGDGVSIIDVRVGTDCKIVQLRTTSLALEFV